MRRSSSATRCGARPIVRSDESPVPIAKATRPGASSARLAHAEASTDTCRVTAFVTPVPSTMRSVATAAAASVT